ncbi:LutC/YkgG family protein [Occallatibacter riparius]|uniref:LUD domain-containing protein n=1 Tax=Occallatibacter riparius TaxID=1002689 RepID=A0A9J7BIK7_9BACT|nr:LUD domain-containing protein [Occallatibacter riparius]UWZ82329.1 LUD domain-containing protein [Occallatibacter riparius]
MSATRSRSAVLGRIRAATTTTPHAGTYESLPRAYRMQGELSSDQCVALLIERLREYDADITECTPDALIPTIATQIAKSGRSILAAPIGLPEDWLVPGCDWRVDHDLSHDQIEQTQGVVTAATCAVAESGTIVLHHGPAEGRRVLSLLPDWHLCVLKTSQVVETLPEYFARCDAPPALATFISGPSATADIEMTRIKGVHGPRFLNVIVVRD